ncbi:MAG: hydroxyacid dehydrogenase [Tropicimonas sp.]|uniref:hydroxyacid dehydrogenase n=1 Tax=Tropicimonas sp. TaxID=2067044 RepID=UPI003A8C1000
MKTVLLSHRLYKDGMEALDGKANVVITDNGDSDEILPQLRQADGFILRIGKIDRKAIEACDRLQVIARPGVGVDSVDIAAATERGIPVVVAPGANSRSVAEHAVALMFAIGKNLIDSDREVRKGNFQVREKYATQELTGATAGVVGFGAIGRHAAQMLSGCGLNVVVFDPFVPAEKVEAAGYSPATSLEALLKIADVVSLHMPATPETRDMINADRLAVMKPNAFLINTSRGELIDEAALCDALREHRIAGAGLDVLKQEPMAADHPLYALENFVVSPHLAAQTPQATARAVVMAVNGTLATLDGKRWPHVFNPDVYMHPNWAGAEMAS